MHRHDAERRSAFAGVTAADLDADKAIWSAVGAALANAAHLLAQGCRTAHYGQTRPSTMSLCSRLVESIDDQVDVSAWSVIEAAARAAAIG